MSIYIWLYIIRTLKWKRNIEENTKFLDGTDLPFILVGNKLDLLNESSNLNDESEFKDFSQKNNFIECFRCSAKENINIADAMEFLVKYAIDKFENISKDQLQQKKESIILEKNNKNLNSSNTCC